MTTRRTAKSTAKKSLGNLLREEVQKESDPARETEAPKGEAPDQTHTPQISQSSVSSDTDSDTNIDPNPDPNSDLNLDSGNPEAQSTEVYNPDQILATLERLKAQLDQAQQENAALSNEKADLEERLTVLRKNLIQEEQLRTQAEEQVSQLKTELQTVQTNLSQAQLSQAQLSQTQLSQTPVKPAPSTALTVLPRSARFQTLALPRAFSRPIVDRPTPWEIPRRPLVITGTTPASPSDLSDEDIGWFD